MTDSIDNQVSCLSCGAVLAGSYCSECGDEHITAEKRTVQYFLANTVMSEVFNVDGRIWLTLRLLMLRPGFLAAEYASGRRRPYVNSLRIMLVSIILFAVAMAGTNYTLTFPLGDFVLRLNTIPSPMFAGSSVEGALLRSDPYGVVEGMLEAKLGMPVSAIEDSSSGERFNEILVNLATPLSFTVIVFVAMLLYLLFNRRRPLFVDHLVFAMNYYSFLLITAMLSALVFKLAGRQLSGGAVLLVLLGFGLWRFAYMSSALRHFYFAHASRLHGWPASMSLAVLLQLFNAICITSIQMACGAVAVWLL